MLLYILSPSHVSVIDISRFFLHSAMSVQHMIHIRCTYNRYHFDHFYYSTTAFSFLNLQQVTMNIKENVNIA